MSEFISVCPKCHQRILCDTAYVGQRIACPVCLQEIDMPEPPKQVIPLSEASSATPVASAAGGQRGVPVSLVVIGAAVLILAAGVVFWAMRKPAAPSPAPAPVAQAPVVPVPSTPVTKPVSPGVVPVAPNPAAPAAPVAVAPVTSVHALVPAVNAPKITLTPPELRAAWSFDLDYGTVALDATGNGYNAAMVGGQASWTKSAKVGSGALMLGGDSFAQTAGPVVNTTQSFSLAVWVNFDVIDHNHCQSILSIDGNDTSIVDMQWNRGSHGRFLFACKQTDARLADWTVAEARMNVHTNTWYHLAGVFDAAAQTISLYVNGELQQTTPCPTPVQATGRTAIGRDRAGRENVSFVFGTIDDARFYAGVLSAGQIRQLAGK